MRNPAGEQATSKSIGGRYFVPAISSTQAEPSKKQQYRLVTQSKRRCQIARCDHALDLRGRQVAGQS